MLMTFAPVMRAAPNRAPANVQWRLWDTAARCCRFRAEDDPYAFRMTQSAFSRRRP